MFTTTYTDVFSGKNITPAFPQYAAIALTQADLQLAWPAQFQNTNNVVAVLMDITPSAGGFSIRMPDARETGSGFSFTINNPGNFSFNLLDNGGNLILTIVNATARIIWLTSNATQNGLWRNLPASPGGGAVTSVDAISRIGVTNNPDPNLVISGVPITNAGIIKFVLGADLSGLTTFANGTGFSVRTAVNSWNLRSIVGTANQIAVANGNGINGNPTISLPDDILDITSLEVGNLLLSGNTIASTNNNGPIILAPNGIGPIQLTKNTEISSTKTLKFFADNGANYITFRAGASVVNQDFIWPTAAPLPSQVLGFSSGSTLSWVSVPTSGGSSTVNALARFSNTVSGIKDSDSNLSDQGELTLTSYSNTQIKIGGLTGTLPQTIATLTTNLDLIVAPNGDGSLDCLGDLRIKPSNGSQRNLRLYTTANFYAGLRSNNTMTTDVIWSLPVAGATAGYFVTDITNSMSIRAFPVTVVDNVPKFSDTSGSLTASSLSISGAGAATGLASCVFGNISVSVITNTIANTATNTDLSIITNGTGKILLKSTVSTDTNTNLTLSPNGIGVVTSTTDLSLLLAATQLKLRLYNSAGTFYTALQAGAAVGNTTFTLPLAAPAATGIIKSSSAGVMSIDSLGALAGALRTDGSGNITINNITTIANTIASYGDTVGTTQATASAPIYVNSSGAIGLTSSSLAAGVLPATPSLVMADPGADPSTPAGNRIIFYTRSGPSGNTISWSGTGNGGVTTSTTNTVNNKIAVRVNGTFYYLLASNVST